MESDDYKNSVIYRIYCKNPDIKDCYIGSSKCIQDRMNSHKKACNNIESNKYNLKIYEFIRNNGGWDNFDYEILEYYPCNNFEELRQKEQEYINNFEILLNSTNAYVSEKERKEKTAITKKIWRNTENGYKISNESQKRYDDKVKNNPELRQKKKEKRIERDKKNQDKIKEKNKEIVFCESCNKHIKKKDISKHNRTKKHIEKQQTQLSEREQKLYNDMRNKAKEKLLCKYCNIEITKGGWSKHTKTEKHLKNVEIYEKKINELDDKNKILCEEC